MLLNNWNVVVMLLHLLQVITVGSLVPRYVAYNYASHWLIHTYRDLKGRSAPSDYSEVCIVL